MKIQQSAEDYLEAISLAADENGRARLRQKNKCVAGDELELLMPGRGAVPFVLGPMWDESGAPIGAAPHPMMLFETVLPVCAPPDSILRKKIK